MADPDDPFKLSGESSERTVIRPTPGRSGSAPPLGQSGSAPPLNSEGTVIRPAPGRQAAAPNKPAPATPAKFEEASTGDWAAAGINPIVAAANPLIALAARIRGSATQDDIPALRDRIVRELKRFEQKLRAAGIQPDIAHFALCALIDDLVLNTPWGAESNWALETLAKVFHQKWRDAGVRFYEVLKQHEDDPAGQLDMLELMYLCLSLGFEGQYRGEANGPAKIARIRESLYTTIRRQRGDFERELSPHWQGIQVGHKPLASAVPLWVFGLASAALLMLVFIGFSWLISNASNPVFAEIARLPPQTAATTRPLPAIPSPTVATLRTVLAPEIARGIVEVKDDARTIFVSIRGNGSFPAGSANLQGPYANIIQRLADGIKVEPGRVTVSGHTDSTPIHNIRFPSNFELSLARAEAARDVIRAKLPDPDRVVAEGRADAEPVASNETVEGREQNRRIEVAILKTPRPVGQ